jgi:hypothetical protein
MKTVMKVIAGIAGLLVLVIGLALLIAWPFMLMWNYAVVSALSVANPIGYWVAFWLMFFIGSFITASNSSK